MGGGTIDILSVAVGAVSLAGVGLAIYGFADIRDVFAEAYGDVIEVPAEGKRGAGSKRRGGGHDKATSSPGTNDALTHRGEASTR